VGAGRGVTEVVRLFIRSTVATAPPIDVCLDGIAAAGFSDCMSRAGVLSCIPYNALRDRQPTDSALTEQTERVERDRRDATQSSWVLLPRFDKKDIEIIRKDNGRLLERDASNTRLEYDEIQRVTSSSPTCSFDTLSSCRDVIGSTPVATTRILPSWSSSGLTSRVSLPVLMRRSNCNSIEAPAWSICNSQVVICD